MSGEELTILFAINDPEEVGYFGSRDRDGKILVTRHQVGKTARELTFIGRHSPDGFNWGYGGSGPAELALSLLTDALGKEIAERHYQNFKWDVIAKWDQDSWHITKTFIQQWLAAQPPRP